jgi:pimeloyl-ACP methyl ester carboxylesterase
MAITPFRIAIPDAELHDLHAAIARTRWPDEIEDAGWDYGTPLGYLQELVGYWADGFRWREREQFLNALPQFRATVDAPGFEQFGVHFVHQRGVGPSPLPIVLSHGWPSTHYEYHDVVMRLANPGAFGDDPADAFHVVVPSLPGYGFSDIPRARGMTPRVMSTMFVDLMGQLGYERFGAGGCDWGAYVTALLGLDHPDALVGIHMGMLNFRAADYERTEDDLAFGKRAKAWRSEESGYSTIQGTKPQSLAYGLMDSPAGLAAWIVEKWRRWSDCDGDVQRLFTRDELLTTIAIYWFTGTINSANRLYYESRRAPVVLAPGERVRPPAGFLLEREVAGGPSPNIGPPPRSRAEAVYDVQRWTVPDRGLHFPAAETPELYVEELRAFFRHLR